jgi:hypothetical protein
MTNTNTATATFTVVNECSGPTEYSVHAAGCKDLKHKMCNGTWDVDAATAADVIAAELDGELGEMGYDKSNIRIMPCAAKISSV